MKTIIKVSIMVILILSLSVNAQAYVPKEYQNKQYMTDYDVYMISKDNLDKQWAYDNIRQLMISYTNNGRCSSCLDIKMEFYNNILKQKIKEVQKLPNINK